MKHCIMCNDPLPRPIDEYGTVGLEVCQVCWLKIGDDGEIPNSWYGLAPHEHLFNTNGEIIIGGTTFKPLPEPNKDGDYIIDGMIFTPDPDAPSCGIWSRVGKCK